MWMVLSKLADMTLFWDKLRQAHSIPRYRSKVYKSNKTNGSKQDRQNRQTLSMSGGGG